MLTGSVFSILGTSLLTVKTLDSFYDPSQTAAFNSLMSIKNGEAYLVKMSAAKTLSVTGVVIASASLTLKAGWNLVGYPRQAQATIATVLTGIWSQFASAKNFDGFYVKNGTLNSLSNFSPGKGYFVKVSSATTLTY